MLTCGVGTPFTIGHAAMRLKSKLLWLASALYAIGVMTFWGVISTYEDTDKIPGWLNGPMIIGLFGGTIGAVVHSFLIRSSVFRRPQSPYEHAQVTQVPGPPSGHAVQQPPVDQHTTQTHPSAGAVRQPGSPLRANDPVQVGPYRLARMLGKGGQGAVYLGLAPDGTRVAVKVLHDWFAGDEAAKQRFLREVEAARRVAQFSTARVIDVRVDADSAYIVSEFVDGSSLEQLVREQGPRDGDGLTRLALATAGALAAIHKAGIVHRDFKPANVLIGADGPRVIDFGIARALDQTSGTANKIMGTPAYMSPEQFAGGDLTPASDIFSWAATMIYAASGRPAFGADTIPAIVNRVLNHHPDVTCLPPNLRALAAACLDKQPGNRPTASDVMLAIVH
ncbi:serine/threonine-protein kinase [Thermocatellispora tengchongensis]|nr:serine/threonine-protein kinase [Thermocatellispora tengchongensis]